MHCFGRADHVDRAALERLVSSVNRMAGASGAGGGKAAAGIPGIEIKRAFEFGIVLAVRALWEAVGIGPAARGIARPEVARIADCFMDLVGPQRFRDACPRQLSGDVKNASPSSACWPTTAPGRIVADEPVGLARPAT